VPRHRFDQVDVFTAQPLRGNPLAVVHDADDLDVGVVFHEGCEELDGFFTLG